MVDESRRNRARRATIVGGARGEAGLERREAPGGHVEWRGCVVGVSGRGRWSAGSVAEAAGDAQLGTWPPELAGRGCCR